MILFTNLFRNKKNYIYVLLISLIILFILFGFIFNEYYQYLYYDVVGGNRENRTIEILSNDNFEFIDEFNLEFDKLYPKYRFNSYIADNVVNIKSFYDLDEDLIESGIILSKVFADKNKLEVGDIVQININGSIKKLELLKVTGQAFSDVYINQELINEIANEQDLIPASYIMVVKKYKDVDKWIEVFQQNGYTAYIENSVGEQELRDIKKIIDISYYCFIVILIIGVFLILLNFVSFDSDEKEYIRLLKIIGFKRNKLFVYNFMKKNILIFLSMFVSLAMFYFFVLLENSFINKINWLKLNFLDSGFVLFVLLIILIVNFIDSFFCVSKE